MLKYWASHCRRSYTHSAVTRPELSHRWKTWIKIFLHVKEKDQYSSKACGSREDLALMKSERQKEVVDPRSRGSSKSTLLVCISKRQTNRVGIDACQVL